MYMCGRRGMSDSTALPQAQPLGRGSMQPRLISVWGFRWDDLVQRRYACRAMARAACKPARYKRLFLERCQSAADAHVCHQWLCIARACNLLQTRSLQAWPIRGCLGLKLKTKESKSI